MLFLHGKELNIKEFIMKKIRSITALALSSVVLLTLAACGQKTEEGTTVEKGTAALNTIVGAYPEKMGFHDEMQHWGFEVQSGEKFEWSKDMSANVADFAMVMMAEPLMQAGLDVEKLDPEMWLYQEAGKDSMGMEQPSLLILPYNVGDEMMPTEKAEDSMKTLLENAEDNLMYHGDMKHYVLNLGATNEVIWTEELGLNDTDMAFVLEAEPLVAAGLDLDKLEGTGWSFKKADAKAGTPDQIIRTFDLKN